MVDGSVRQRVIPTGPPSLAFPVLAAELRRVLERASSASALEDQRVAFRTLSDIVLAVSPTETILEALHSARRSCLEFFESLERGSSSRDKRRAALVCIDLLEGRFFEAAGPNRSGRGLA